MARLLTKTDVSVEYDQPSWQRVVYSEFESQLTSKTRPFPCVFGVSGLKADQLRFVFLDPLNADALAPVLREYLATARSMGRMTSLVAFARPGPVQDIEAYRARFWGLLDDLARLDTGPQPEGVDEALDRASWEFSFAGEPIFVVCNSPAHVLRQSRRSTSFMITFQPRWVFEGITDTEDPAVQKALRTVRERLGAFDAIAESPYLGKYGDPDNREYRQYFIDDSNDAPACPFRALGKSPGKPSQDKEKVA